MGLINVLFVCFVLLASLLGLGPSAWNELLRLPALLPSGCHRPFPLAGAWGPAAS